ncbi:MAG: DNA-deoxyinosine glycosylase [Ruminococcaceae bacterium]|nr:DNA-deoxyinosine glycosylase [Oscillospiraceae bacterium]
MPTHPINPVYDGNSKILILGSFPSVKSREVNFFYGHPQNRFWRVLSALLDLKNDATVEEKRLFLLQNHIAVWDVISSCEIEGSADSTIKNASANDISVILKAADISAIFVNGKTAEKYYNKYIREKIQRDAICLPSTSAANAAYSLDGLVGEWKKILPFIKQADR